MILLGISVLVMFSRSKSVREFETTIDETLSTDHVKNYVDSCVKESAILAVQEHGMLGSEDLLNKEIRFNLLDCIDDFSAFKGYDITDDDAVVSTELNDDTLIVEVDYPIQVHKGSKKKEFKKFYFTLDKETYIKPVKGIAQANGSISN